MMAHAYRLAYWHSEDVTGYVCVDKCPACGEQHPVVVLYNRSDHEELPPNDFLNGVRVPCGATLDLIFERSRAGGRPYDAI